MAATTTSMPTEAIIREAYDAFNELLSLLQNVTRLMWGVNLEPLPAQLYATGGAGTNCLGLTGHDRTLVLFLVSPSWSDTANDEQVYTAARSLMAGTDERAKKLVVYDLYIYLNYTAPWQDAIQGYGEDNVKKL
jgi:hypothetical protein